MPSVKYYRSVLPLDLLQIVGDFAGDEIYKLVFTFSPKRRFLSNIVMSWRDPECGNYTTVLKEHNWRPVCLGSIAEVLTMLAERCTRIPENILVPSLKRITDILLEVHDYKLRRKVRNLW